MFFHTRGPCEFSRRPKTRPAVGECHRIRSGYLLARVKSSGCDITNEEKFSHKNVASSKTKRALTQYECYTRCVRCNKRKAAPCARRSTIGAHRRRYSPFRIITRVTFIAKIFAVRNPTGEWRPLVGRSRRISRAPGRMSGRDGRNRRQRVVVQESREFFENFKPPFYY